MGHCKNTRTGDGLFVVFSPRALDSSCSTFGFPEAPMKLLPPLTKACRYGSRIFHVRSSELLWRDSDPASLVVGASLGALLTGSISVDVKSKTPKKKLLVRFYNSTILPSFMMSLCTIATSTVAGVTILRRDFDPIAESDASDSEI
jgi:hypothetical protein